MSIQPVADTNPIKKTDSPKGYAGVAITETVTNGLFTVDRKWTVLYWNRAAEKLLGIPAKDIVGKNIWEKFGEVIPLNFYTIYQQAFLQDITVHLKEYWAKMGTWFDVITYHCDNTLSISFKSINQPAPVKPQLQLKILNELYRYVTEVTNDCLWEWDLLSKEIFWIDGGHKRFFGYPLENALIPQIFWESLLHPDDKARILAGLEKIIKQGRCKWEDEYRFKKADGEYAFVHDRGQIIYDDSKIACRMIGATQDITVRKLTEIKLKETEKKLWVIARQTQKEITYAVLTAQENERSDIGKELHDNVNQILGATKLYIEMANTDTENRTKHLKNSAAHINRAIEEIRKISKNLVPLRMDFMGLSGNIKILIDDLRAVHPIKIEFHEKQMEKGVLNEKLQLNIFRIVQEQLNNIIKHSQATIASIDLSMHANKIILVVSDNGRGCEPSVRKKGTGIRNITSRAELYQGNVSIVTKPGEGYTLKVVFPLQVQIT
jgi:PAS domain S-box-containing protein